MAASRGSLLTHTMSSSSNWKPFIDFYGAKGFKDEAGEVVFSGDECGMYPYFNSHKALMERLALHDESDGDEPGDFSPISA